jgi:hypothetical protein
MQAEFKVVVKTYWNKTGKYELIDTTIEEGAEEGIIIMDSILKSDRTRLNSSFLFKNN